MSSPPEHTVERVSPTLLATRLAVVVGVGAVGSQVARELANNHIGRLRLIDYDTLEAHNLHRHVLTSDYVGQNKAKGMRRYFSKEAPAVKVEALPWHIDQNISDTMLDGILHDTDLIVIATDDRATQWRIARRALALDIPAVVPGLYERKGGEVVVQLSPELPCFFCRDGFRPADQTIRGATSGNADILAVIQLASQLSLALLDGSSEYQRLLAIRRGESQPSQLFIHNDLVLATHTLRWRPNCPSCAVGPSPLRPDAFEAWEAAEARRRGDQTPRPTTAVRPEPVAQPLTSGEIQRRLALIAAGVALLIGVLVLASSGGHSGAATSSSAPPASPPVESRAQEEAKYQKLAEARIAQLSFECLDGDACHANPEGHSLPIFISGMDENLRDYLEKVGYRDQWTDSGGGIDGQTIGPSNFVGQSPTATYVTKVPEAGMPVDEFDTGASFGSGLLYEERGEHENQTETGVIPWDVHGGEQWTIIWTLWSPSGQVARQLQYSVKMVACTPSAVSYCEEAKFYGPNEPATPPPAFPKEALSVATASSTSRSTTSDINLGPIKGVAATQLDSTTVEINWEDPHDPAVLGYIISENSPEGESSGSNTGPDPNGTSVTEHTNEWEPKFRPQSGQLWQFCVAPFGHKLQNGEYTKLPNRESCTQQVRWR